MGRVTTREAVLRLSANADADGAHSDRALRSRDTLVAEEPLEIRIAGKQIAVTMRTPGDDFDLVAGYLVGEGVIRSPEQLARMRFCGDSACSGPIGLVTDSVEVGSASMLNFLGNGAIEHEPTSRTLPEYELTEHTASEHRLAGRESAGRESAGRESAGRESAGRESAANTSIGYGQSAHTLTKHRSTEHRSTEHGSTEHGSAEPCSAEHVAPGLAAAHGRVEATHDTYNAAHDTYNIVDVDLAPGTALPLWSLDRTTYTTSACGVCGKSSIEAVRANAHWSVESDPVRISPRILYSLPKTLRAGQKLFAKTGGLHAAGLFTSEGELVCLREDVGRHNAVDKVIGWALRADRLPLRGHLLAVSGRASFELVQKAAAAGIPVLAAVSAPSSLAVELAREAGMTLAGFVRGESANVYAGAERISLPGTATAD